MIAYIKGTLEGMSEDTILLENQGVAYEIFVPASVFGSLPSMGSPVKIHTYLNVREDAMQLFGFMAKDDLDIFKLLITVNGIGPKGALGILSALSPDDLRFAILSEDVKTISRSPGIGAKTAGKLILELKDKLKLEDAFEKKLAGTEAAETGLGGLKNDAVAALTALGYSATEALQAVRKIDINPEMAVEDILKAALKKMV